VTKFPDEVKGEKDTSLRPAENSIPLTPQAWVPNCGHTAFEKEP